MCARVFRLSASCPAILLRCRARPPPRLWDGRLWGCSVPPGRGFYGGSMILRTCVNKRRV
eukprot:7220183-Pyramimonas_sp.AAC.1